MGTRAAGDQAQQIVRKRHAGVDTGGADVSVIPRDGHGDAGLASLGDGPLRGQVRGEIPQTAVAVHGQAHGRLTRDARLGRRVEPTPAKLVRIVGEHPRAVRVDAAQVVGGQQLGQLSGVTARQTQGQGHIAREALQPVGRHGNVPLRR